MDFQFIINLAVGLVVGVGGWFARQLWDSVKELKNDLSSIRLHMSENYVKKSEVEGFRADMDRRFDRIEQLLDKLYERLDHKVDK
jgi:predicted negative regulator of RcsB-dependent stress response